MTFNNNSNYYPQSILFVDKCNFFRAPVTAQMLRNEIYKVINQSPIAKYENPPYIEDTNLQKYYKNLKNIPYWNKELEDPSTLLSYNKIDPYYRGIPIIRSAGLYPPSHFKTLTELPYWNIIEEIFKHYNIDVESLYKEKIYLNEMVDEARKEFLQQQTHIYCFDNELKEKLFSLCPEIKVDLFSKLEGILDEDILDDREIIDFGSEARKSIESAKGQEQGQEQRNTLNRAEMKIYNTFLGDLTLIKRICSGRTEFYPEYLLKEYNSSEIKHFK